MLDPHPAADPHLAPPSRCRHPSRLPRWAVPTVGLLLALLASPPDLKAHPISLTSAVVNVVEEKVTVQLNVMVEDLVLYYAMDAGPDFRFPLADLKEKALEHREFLLMHLHLRDRDGRRLEGRIVDIDFSDLDPDGVPIGALMAHSMIYQFEFPLEERIGYLTVGQDFGGENPAVPAEMEVRVFHNGIRMGPTAVLSHHTAHTVRLDWDLDWEELRSDLATATARIRERREDELGITSYSSVYSYVYITDTEVRHELLIPLLTLDTWLPLPRKDPRVMTVAEQQAVRDDVLRFLRRHNSVEINGTDTAPTLVRLDFFGPDFRDFARRAPEQEVSVYNARVGVVLAFPSPEIPRSAKFEWDYYNEQLPFLRPRIYVFEEESIDALLEYYRPAFEWKHARERDPVALAFLEAPEPAPRLRLPLGSLSAAAGALILGGFALRAGRGRRRLILAIGAGVLASAALAALGQVTTVPNPFHSPPQIDEDRAHAVFQTLHANIYRAFEFRDEERIYDALEQSVAGRLLEDLYLQFLRGLRVEEEGGTVSRVEDIEIVGGSVQPRAGPSGAHPKFEYRSTWTVTGTVEHWGHIHTRKNQYEAVFAVEGLPSGWKITGFEPLREERLQFAVRLRN